MNRTPLPALLALPLAVALALPGCTAPSAGRYPSLLPRAIEKRSDAEPVIEEQAVVADPALDAKIKVLVDAQAASVAGLATAAARAEQMIAAAKGAAAGSDRWIEAQSALAELDSFRADASARLSDFEQLEIERAAENMPEYPALVAARSAAEADSEEQGARIARLQTQIAPS